MRRRGSKPRRQIAENPSDAARPPAKDAAGERSVASLTETRTLIRVQAPLPPPQVLRGYDEVVPGAGERILAMAERAQSDAHSARQFGLEHAVRYLRRGQFFGFFASLVAFAVVGFAAYHGREVVASIVGGSTVVGLVIAFVATGRNGSSAAPGAPDPTDDLT